MARPRDSNQVHVRRAASVDEQLTERGLLGIDREGMVAVKIAEGTQLFVARRGGQRHLFVAGEGYAADDGANPCCLTIWEISHGSDHTINLTLVANTSQTGITIAMADLDADGTDELFVIEGPWGWEGTVPPPAQLALLRWDRRSIRPARDHPEPLAGFRVVPQRGPERGGRHRWTARRRPGLLGLETRPGCNRAGSA